MTEESQENQSTTESAPQSVQIDIGRIIYAILKHNTEVSVPSDLIINPVPDNTEIEIKYNGDAKQFLFSLKDKVEENATAN